LKSLKYPRKTLHYQNNLNMTDQKEIDLLFTRAIRPHIGEEWHLAKPKIIAKLPEGTDPSLIARYVDDSDQPSVNLNAYGVEPRFYAHRDSKRLLEFYWKPYYD